MDVEAAQRRMRECAFQQKFIETGKVLLTHNALKYSNVSSAFAIYLYEIHYYF